MFQIESYRDYTEQEIQQSWYTESHLEMVVTKRCEAALEWEQADKSLSSSSPSGLYMRGLEHYTTEGETRMERTVQRHLDVVMDEQDIQWANGQDDYERFAVVSQAISKYSVGLALIRAEQDELEAKRAYQSMEIQEILKSKRRNHVVANKKEEPTIVVSDDHTSVCSDLSLQGVMDSLHSRDDSTYDGLEVKQGCHNGNGTTRESKLEAMRLKIMEISDVLLYTSTRRGTSNS